MKRLAGFVGVIIIMLSTTIGADAAITLVRVSNRAPVEMDQVVKDIARADVIFVGDTHDDIQLHGKQLEILRSLYAANPHLAIGVEMFTMDDQRYLEDWTAGKLEEKDFIPIYSRNWSYDWRLYRDLFVFARDNHIPMLALNVPKAVIAKVVRQGAKALSESERKELPPGPWTLNARQGEYLRRIRQQVFGNRPSPVPTANFDEAQALRNDTFAYNIFRFREKYPDRKVVVIAGTWHAIRNGAPDSLRKYGSCSCKVVLPDLLEFDWLKPTAEDVDYLIN